MIRLIRTFVMLIIPGESLLIRSRNVPFSTYDRDNDYMTHPVQRSITGLGGSEGASTRT